MTLARYPNSGYLLIAAALDANGDRQTGPDGKFVCDDPRAALGNEQDIWLHGFWVWDWADLRDSAGQRGPCGRTISLGPGAGQAFRMRTGSGSTPKTSCRNSIAPASGTWIATRRFSTSGLRRPFVRARSSSRSSAIWCGFDDVSHVTFRGLLIEAGRGSAWS